MLFSFVNIAPVMSPTWVGSGGSTPMPLKFRPWV